MTIPAAQLTNARNLLLLHPTDTVFDTAIASEWDQQVALLSRRYDLFPVATTMAAVVGQAIYSAPANTSRIISVFHRRRALGYTDQTTLALRDADWENALPGTPKYWSYNTVPNEVDNSAALITPREFVIAPAPDGAQSGVGRILVLSQTIPNTVPIWLEPILLYLTVGSIAGQDPNIMQTEKSEFFIKLAEVWLDAVRRRHQI